MLAVWQRWRADTLAWIAIACAAGHYAFRVLPRRAELGLNIGSFDIYAWAYPNFLYGLRALEQGHGLLWNSLQNCGQPYLGFIQLALFYPLNLLFLVLPTDTALVSIIALHLVIGGMGSYLLLGEFAVGRVARLCGALAFELGAITLYLAAWMPVIAGAYVWLPWALLCCEKILKTPRSPMGAALAVVLTVELLSGFPQVTFFIYQLIALRVVWELFTCRQRISAHTFRVLALGLLLPLLLGAVQMLPALEVAGESVRQGSLSSAELRAGSISWDEFRTQTGLRSRGGPYGNSVAMVAVAFAALGLMQRRTRRLAVFAALVTLLYVALAFNETAFELYARLPFGAHFRNPSRFLWCAAFSSSLLVAFGVSAVTDSAHEGSGLLVRTPIACLLSVVALYWLAPAAVQTWEYCLLLGVLIASLGATLGSRGVQMASLALPVLLAANLYMLGSTPWLGLVKDNSIYYQHSDAFEFVRSRQTPQDRMKTFGALLDYSLIDKSASVYGLPSIADYEPQTSRRYAELFVRLVSDLPMHSVNQFYYQFRIAPRNRPLLNLTATRYLIADTSEVDMKKLVKEGMQLVWKRENIRVYENLEALPRAYFVPRIKQMPDSPALLSRLARPGHDPRKVALVTEPPPHDFPSGRSTATGEVTIVRDRSEEVTLQVEASAAGFLVLTDQYYPGWEATVNGEPAAVLVANHAFRLVQVPAGPSEVVFRYRSNALRIGAMVSATTLLAVVGVFAWPYLRRPQKAEPARP